MTLLSLDAVSLSYGARKVLDGLTLSLDKGEVLALAGASGSGKSSMALAVLRLLPGHARLEGSIRLGDDDLTGFDERRMRAVRGGRIGLIFQEPMTALDPVMPIGKQIAETLRLHTDLSHAAIHARVAALLRRVGLAEIGPDRYPHQLSGGQRQRVAIAAAIAVHPELIIADEPTTALDATIQAQILDLLRRLTREEDCGLLLITHDLAVVAEYADRVALIERGRIVETGPVTKVFSAPQRVMSALIAGAATPPQRAMGTAGETLLTVTGICHRYGDVQALDGIDFVLRAGESLGIVGESGSGKSTLLKTVLGLIEPQGGTVTIAGSSFATARGAALRALRRRVQAVFQDPLSSFDPRHKIWRIVAEPLHLCKTRMGRDGVRARVDAALVSVGLPTRAADRYPHEFSGGQRQRIAIARALILSPSLIAFDEALSALDAAARAEILSLLNDLSRERKLSYLFVTHDLDQARAVSDRLIVMHEGRVVEAGATAAVLDAPRHPYTQDLIAAAPNLSRALKRMRV